MGPRGNGSSFPRVGAAVLLRLSMRRTGSCRSFSIQMDVIHRHLVCMLRITFGGPLRKNRLQLNDTWIVGAEPRRPFCLFDCLAQYLQNTNRPGSHAETSPSP